MPLFFAYFNSLFNTSASYSRFPPEDTFDIQTVLADDMLVKADRFSMRHGLEIRNPFLDYRVVEYALNLPTEKKISRKGQKLILRETFSELLPAEIFTRKKQGFELPVRAWLTGKLSSRLENEWFNKEKINADKIFNYDEIELIRKQLLSANPGDSGARAWAIIVFTAWMDRHSEYISLPHAE